MKYAVVTGSTKGIGLAISKKLIESNYFVFMNYAFNDNAADIIDLQKDMHKIIKADLSTTDGADKLTKMILSERIELDCVVFNAGATCRKPFGEITYEEWNAVMNANVNIPFLICQKLHSIIKVNSSIIFIGSDMGIYPHATSCAYSVSKAATHMLAKSLVKEMAEKRIRVNALAPGFIDTEWQKIKPQWQRKKIEEKTALKRFGAPGEVADACLCLIENNYINGAVLQVDGGYCFE